MSNISRPRVYAHGFTSKHESVDAPDAERRHHHNDGAHDTPHLNLVRRLSEGQERSLETDLECVAILGEK